MKLSYINGFGNKGNTFLSQGISKESLPYQANSNNTPKYLTPDYFLPASQSESYYSKKYSCNHTTSDSSIGIRPICQSKRSKISRVASIMLLSLGFFATAVEVEAENSIELHEEASSGQQKEATFETITLSNNLPDVIPQLPLPDLIPSNPPVTPPPPPPMPDIVPPVILPDVVPNPAAPPPMPDLLGDSGSSMPKQKTGFMAAMKQIAKGNFKLKKVQAEPKPVIISDDKADLMSQILARREAITGEKQDNKFKNIAKQVIVLTAEEQKARDTEISQKIAANKEKAATLRKQKEKEWAIKAKQIEAEVEIEKQRKAAEHARAMKEQKAKESGSDSSIVIAGIDPVLHNNIVADLRQEISALKEQLTLKGNDNAEGIKDLGSNGNARSKRSLEDRLYDEKLENWEFEGDEAVKKLDEVISTYSDSDSGYDDEALADSSDRGSNNSLDTNDVVSAIVSQSNSIVSEIVQEELAGIEKELQSQKLKEGKSVGAVEDILSEDLMTDTGGSPADANHSTARHQEVLAERTGFAVSLLK